MVAPRARSSFAPLSLRNVASKAGVVKYSGIADPPREPPTGDRPHAMTFRLEKDPLGEKAVPADALYGIQTLRAAENFPISGLRPLPAFVDAVVMIKRSAAVTHRETGPHPGFGSSPRVGRCLRENQAQRRRHASQTRPSRAGVCRRNHPRRR